MDARIAIDARRLSAGLLFAACAAAALPAGAGPHPLPPVQAVLQVVDCVDRAPPLQREVAGWTGQHNAGQAWATRQRLMAEVARACRREGIGEVWLVLEPGAHGGPGAPAVVAAAPR